MNAGNKLRRKNTRKWQELAEQVVNLGNMLDIMPHETKAYVARLSEKSSFEECTIWDLYIAKIRIKNEINRRLPSELGKSDDKRID